MLLLAYFVRQETNIIYLIKGHGEAHVTRWHMPKTLENYRTGDAEQMKKASCSGIKHRLRAQTTGNMHKHKYKHRYRGVATKF